MEYCVLNLISNKRCLEIHFQIAVKAINKKNDREILMKQLNSPLPRNLEKNNRWGLNVAELMSDKGQREEIDELFYNSDFKNRMKAANSLFYYGKGSIVAKVLKISYKTDSHPTVKLNSLQLYKLLTTNLLK